MKTVLVSGTGGFVGSRILQQLQGRVALSSFPKGMMTNAGEKEIRAFIEAQQPDVILHTAAISDISTCEKNPELSYRANVELPVWVAQGAKSVGAKLISCSSDQVYAGKTHGVFTEEEPLAPANLYGRHKVEAEQRLLELLPSAVSLRLNWMYDLPLYGERTHSNFLVWLLSAAARGETVRISENTYQCITYVRQVVENLIPAMEIEGGVYNFGSPCPMNLYETACCLKETFGLKGLTIEKDESRAPSSLSINTDKLRAQGVVFDTSAEGFRRCVEDYRLQPFLR